jgi:flagellar basal-body rod protein FlgB
MDALSAAVMIKALDSLTARQAATAENIANAGTDGYRPLKVSFEDELRAAAGRGVADVRAVHPHVELDPSASEADGMRLDLQLLTAASTAGRYGALAELLNRELQIDAMAVSEIR